MLRSNRHIPMATWWIVLLAVLLAGVWSVMYIFTLPQGDDLGYTVILHRADGSGVYSLLTFPRFWVRHWVMNNGRTANLLAALTMGVMPHWLVSVMCGLATGAMYLLVLRCCRLFPSRGRAMAATVVVAVVALLFPWWDSFSLLDVNFNYVWATVMTLVALLMIRHSDERAGLAQVGAMDGVVAKLRTIGAAALCLLAGMSHEAASLPACVGMAWVAYAGGNLSLTGWRRQSLSRRVLLASFLVGTALVALAPGTIMRALRGSSADDQWWVLILKSAPITLVLLAAMALALLRKPWRRRLHTLLMGEWGFWAVSAIAGLLFVAVGGIVGRSGWFSQVAAIVALCRWLRPEAKWLVDRRVAATVAATLGTVVVAQMVGVDVYSYKVWTADRQLRELYAASPDGIVCCDLPADHALPWWAFSRVRTLRPEDDYSHYGLRAYYRKSQSLINLPAAAATIDWATLEEWTSPGDSAVRILATCPAGTLFPTDPGWVGWHVGRRVADNQRREWVIAFEKQGRTYYYVRPYRPRWGERF